MVGPAQTLGRRRACAIGSGVWQVMMGGKGCLSETLVVSGASIGFRQPHPGCHGHARTPLSRACKLAYPEAQQPPGPSGEPMNDETAPRTPPAKPAAAGARKSDPRAGERLAAAVRENLRRRTQQAKARRSDADPAGGQGQD